MNFIITKIIEDQLHKLSELVNVSKSKLKVFAILLLSIKNTLFSLNAIFDSPKEYLFEKYSLQLFQNGFDSFQLLPCQNDPF